MTAFDLGKHAPLSLASVSVVKVGISIATSSQVFGIWRELDAADDAVRGDNERQESVITATALKASRGNKPVVDKSMPEFDVQSVLHFGVFQDGPICLSLWRLQRLLLLLGRRGGGLHARECWQLRGRRVS